MISLIQGGGSLKADELIQWCNYIYEEDIEAGELEDEDWFRLFNNAFNDGRILRYIKIDWWETTPIQADTADYGLPDEFIKEKFVGIGDTRVQENLTQLKRLSMLDFDSYGYKIKNNNKEIQLQPKPTSTSGFLHVCMEKKPKKITDVNQEIEVLDPYIIGHHAIYQAELKNKAFDKAQIHWGELMGRADASDNTKRKHPRYVRPGGYYD